MTASGEDRPARGRNLLEELTEIAKNFEKMERKVRMLTAKQELLNAKVSSHETMLRTLETASEEDCDVKEGIFDGYKEGKDGRLIEQKDRETGNVAALGGDAVTDATLYYLGRIHGVRVFKEIYYFSPGDITAIHERKDILSLYVINQRATLVADPLAIVPPQVELAFRDFVRALEEHWGRTVDVTQQDSRLTQAYWEFCRIYGKAERNGEFKG